MIEAKPLIGVAVVDDNELIGESVERWLNRNAGFEFLGAYPSGEQAVQALAAARPCVVLLDVDIPGSNSFDTLDRIARERSDIRVVMLSGHVEPEYIERSLDRGACGYIVKDEGIPVILDLIRRVSAGEIVLSPTAKSALLMPRV